ncbi:hypothetical protein Tco_1176260 [Tanacetum coccineum]
MIPSSFLANNTGASQGEELGLIKPSSDSSFSCSTTLSFQKVPIDKALKLRVQYQLWAFPLEVSLNSTLEASRFLA